MAKHPLQTMLEDGDFKVQDYSGRAMYGKRCLAVVVNSSQLGALIQHLMESCLSADIDDQLDEATAARDVKNIRWDNMGLDMVYYWPNVPFTDDEEYDEDEDETEGQAHQPEREDGA